MYVCMRRSTCLTDHERMVDASPGGIVAWVVCICQRDQFPLVIDEERGRKEVTRETLESQESESNSMGDITHSLDRQGTWHRERERGGGKKETVDIG